VKSSSPTGPDVPPGRDVAVAPREERVPVRNGLQIFIRSWIPATRPRAIVGIVHGVKSHGGHYHWAAKRLAARGFAVYALDLHGRGQSDGERFYLEQMSDYVDDAHTLVIPRPGGSSGDSTIR
jgi:acylglycerol lipase